MSNNSVIMVVSAPSGTGKTSICRPLLREFPALRFSVSFTTRPPRRGEADGRDYHFVTPDAFREKIQAGDFVEWAENYGHLYGTSRGVIEEIRERYFLISPERRLTHPAARVVSEHAGDLRGNAKCLAVARHLR